MTARCDYIKLWNPSKQFNNSCHITGFNSFFQQASVPIWSGQRELGTAISASIHPAEATQRGVHTERRMGVRRREARLNLHQKLRHWNCLIAHQSPSINFQNKGTQSHCMVIPKSESSPPAHWLPNGPPLMDHPKNQSRHCLSSICTHWPWLACQESKTSALGFRLKCKFQSLQETKYKSSYIVYYLGLWLGGNNNLWVFQCFEGTHAIFHALPLAKEDGRHAKGGQALRPIFTSSANRWATFQHRIFPYQVCDSQSVCFTHYRQGFCQSLIGTRARRVQTTQCQVEGEPAAAQREGGRPTVGFPSQNQYCSLKAPLKNKCWKTRNLKPVFC